MYALTLLVRQQEGHPACKNWVVGHWFGYVSWSMCRFAYGPADATATHYLMLQYIQICFIFLVLPFWWWLTRVVPPTHTEPFYGSMDSVRDNPGEPVPEETFTHSHLSWSSIVPYLLHPSTTIPGLE